MASPSDEVTSDPHRRRNPDDDDDGQEQLARQSSIYSLTLDEIQNTVCEPGRGFGSMNMDEFITNIWSADEASDPPADVPGVGGPPLLRQGSLTVPAPLCRKTVDEVWEEIRKEEDLGIGGGPGNAHRQPTFGEMTLEDFLVKAGVVREGLGLAPSGPMQQSYGTPTSYPVKYWNGYGGGGTQGSLASPVSSDGWGGGHVDNGKGGGGKMNGRKRVADRVVEKVAERRQRRMIKNRESAARSRARKQAYTVELEAELNQLKDENSRLREEERRAQALRKQMMLERMAEHTQANMKKALRSLRRCNSVPW